MTNGFSVLVFGGFEAGQVNAPLCFCVLPHQLCSKPLHFYFRFLRFAQRVNSLLSLEVTSCSWSILPTKGDVPCPRSYHAANRYRNLMLIHGGEGKQDSHQALHQVSFDHADQQQQQQQQIAAEMSRSVDNSSHPTLQPMHSQSTSVLNVPGMQETKPAFGHDGVTLGDTLCGTKLAGQIKVRFRKNFIFRHAAVHLFVPICLYLPLFFFRSHEAEENRQLTPSQPVDQR